MISNKYHPIHRYYIFHSKSMCYHKCRGPSLLALDQSNISYFDLNKTRVSLLTYGRSSSKPYTPIFNIFPIFQVMSDFFFFVQAIAKFYHCLTIETNYQLSLVIVLLILRLYSLLLSFEGKPEQSEMRGEKFRDTVACKPICGTA